VAVFDDVFRKNKVMIIRENEAREDMRLGKG
jgi:hypothetical protein